MEEKNQTKSTPGRHNGKKNINSRFTLPFPRRQIWWLSGKKMSWYSRRKCNRFFRIRNTCARACAIRLAGKSTSDMCWCGGVIIFASEKPVVPGTRSEKEIQLHSPSRLIRGTRYQHHVYFSPNNCITAGFLVVWQLYYYWNGHHVRGLSLERNKK